MKTYLVFDQVQRHEGVRSPTTHWTGDWSPSGRGEEKMTRPCRCRESNPGRPVRSTVISLRILQNTLTQWWWSSLTKVWDRILCGNLSEGSHL